MWKLVGVAALLALVVVAVRLASRPQSAARPEPAPEALEERAESPELAAEIARALEALPQDARAPAGVPATAPAADRATLVVRVVESAAPAVGAEVFLVDWGTVDREAFHEFREGFRPGQEREAETFGARANADARGEARFPKPRASARVLARRGDGFATLDLLGAEPGPVELVLERDPPVRVRVVDRDGKPAQGVPVSLRSPTRGGDVLLATTGEGGLAELRARENRPTLVREGASVALAIPLRVPVETAVDLEAPPADPIRLVLPPLGSVEVELVDASGAPWTKPEQVLVDIAPSLLVELGARAESWQWRKSTGGRALFEHMGLGLELRFLVDPDEHSEVRVKARGPAEPGERVNVRLAIGERFRVLTGRVVDERGTPFRSVALQLEFRRARGGSGGPARTDDDGRFRRTLEHLELSPDPVTVEITITEPRGMEHFARLEGVRLSSGDTDLGDIVLARTPLVASGIVLDERGQPVRQAEVQFYTGATEGVRYSGSRVDDVECDALGRFELRRVLAEPLVGIGVSAECCSYGGPWVVATGSSGLELAIERGGWIAGRVRMEGGQWPTLRVEQGGRPVGPGSFRIDAMSGFRIGPVAPGSYSLAYGFQWMDEFPSIDGIEVVAGEETRDPRLDPLELALHLPKLVLTVVDVHGAPVSGLTIGVWCTGTEEFIECHPRGDGERWTFVAGKLPLRLNLSARGFRALELDAVDADRRVVMQRGIPVRLELAGALPAPPPGWRIDGALRAEGVSWHGRAADFAWTAGAVDMHVSEAGSYSVTFELTRPLPGGGELHETSFWNEAGNTLDVVDGVEPQVFRVDAPSPEVVREMSAYIEENE